MYSLRLRTIFNNDNVRDPMENEINLTRTRSDDESVVQVENTWLRK